MKLLDVPHDSSHGHSTQAAPVFIAKLYLTCASSIKSLAKKKIYSGQELIIGRDKKKWYNSAALLIYCQNNTFSQWIINDPRISNKHLRVYTIIYENEEDGELQYIVYAEDLSRHGTFWNGSLMGRDNGGFLLSHNDRLRLSATMTLRFVSSKNLRSQTHFDIEVEKEMDCFSHKYTVTDRLLGAGAFGRVFMAIEQHTRTQVACKVMKLRQITKRHPSDLREKRRPIRAGGLNQSLEIENIKEWGEHMREKAQIEKRLKTCYHEIEILSQLKHPNIVSLEKVFVTKNTIYMFQDLITAGDLFSYLEFKNGQLAEVEAAVIIRQILVALQFMHSQNIVHRDLKPENVMMTSLSVGCRVVLTDFGAAKRLDTSKRMHSVVGSLPYTAPEVISMQTNSKHCLTGYTKAVDMWSVGAIIVVLLTGNSAFSDPRTGEYLPSMAQRCNLNNLAASEVWRQIRARPKDLVVNLLVLNESERMSAQQALKHEWFSNDIHKTDFEDLYQRTIRNWRPRSASGPIVEFIDAHYNEWLAPPSLRRRSSKRVLPGPKPIEPPYRPFPENMYKSLRPFKRKRTRSFPLKIDKAINEIWNETSATMVGREQSRPSSTRSLDESTPKQRQRSSSMPLEHLSDPAYAICSTEQYPNSRAQQSSSKKPVDIQTKIWDSAPFSKFKLRETSDREETPEPADYRKTPSPSPKSGDTTDSPTRHLKKRARTTTPCNDSRKRIRSTVHDTASENEKDKGSCSAVKQNK